MKLITYISLLFIAYELLKIVMFKTYWRLTMTPMKFKPISVLDSLYLVFLIYLFFTPYWFVGVGILIISVVTAFQLVDYVRNKLEMNSRIRGYLFADGIVSILMLLMIILGI
jgi:hypothetical protein